MIFLCQAKEVENKILVSHDKRSSYINDDIAAKVREISDHLFVLLGDLGMLDQLGEVLLGNAWR